MPLSMTQTLFHIPLMYVSSNAMFHSICINLHRLELEGLRHHGRFNIDGRYLHTKLGP